MTKMAIWLLEIIGKKLLEHFSTFRMEKNSSNTYTCEIQEKLSVPASR